MAWERVGSGTIDDGRAYEVQRQVLHLAVPASVARLLIRRNAYRLQVEQPDGSVATVRRAARRDLLWETVGE